MGKFSGDAVYFIQPVPGVYLVGSHWCKDESQMNKIMKKRGKRREPSLPSSQEGAIIERFFIMIHST